MILDVVMLLAVLLGVFYFRFGFLTLSLFSVPGLWPIILLVLVCLYIFGTYDLDFCDSERVMAFKTLGAMLIGLVAVIIMNYLLAKDRSGLFGRGVLLGSLVIFTGLTILLRVGAVRFFNTFRQQLNWLLVIEDSFLEVIQTDFGRHGISDEISILSRTPTFGVVGQWSDLDRQLDRRWSGVICGLTPENLSSEVGQTLMKAKLAGHHVISLGQFYERHWAKVPIYVLNPEWFIAADSFNLVHHPVGLRVKRLADITLSAILLLFTWPFMLLCMLAIRLESAGQIIYKQVRTGKDGRLFTIYKFRSMVMNAEENGVQWAKENDGRITRVGRFMRVTRLDELPQLFNVFKGDMSFVGPRPERPEFNGMLETKIPYYGLRHLVRPGITGWAQVSYAYGASIEDAKEKLQYDLFYIKHFSFVLDFIIILRTIRVILFSRGR